MYTKKHRQIFLLLQEVNADLERIKNISITPELAWLAKDAFMSKYTAKGEEKFVEYFRKYWADKKWAYTEVNALLVFESAQEVQPGVCVPPQSNAIERVNRSQKQVKSAKCTV